ncbi:endonuclease domain-containing 1 protein-like [Platysternon megacephalum]|uniref:Endonuclease domain-containing 1 protein-like n=1 Tax=Platysternon megacephalum TaxID=55544 RepID=A0A4D9DHI4_9SAUR|nr:endonuclease domain-containing 1 protein-like [Platysternon megacephalum]
MDSFITPVRTSDFVLAPRTFGLVWRKRYNRDSSEEEEDSLTQLLMDTLEPDPETLVTHSDERDGLSLSTPLEVEGDCGLGESPADKVNGKDGAQKDDKQRNINRDAERVVVPSHIWTAVCCEHSDNNKKFSFAFLGMNRPDSILEPMKVTQLNKELTRLYGNPSGRPIKIFNDDCNEDSTKAQHVLLEITKQLCDTFPNWGNHLSGNKRPQNNPPAIDSSKKKPKP